MVLETGRKVQNLAFIKLGKKFINVYKLCLTFRDAFAILFLKMMKGVMAMARIGYRRSSTNHQKGGLDRQSVALPQDLDKVFTDEASGKDTDRPEFKKMMEYIREGDIVFFESFSRISRSLSDLLKILDTFNQKGVSFVSVKENIDTSGATGKLIVSVLGAINAYEREINEERREYNFRKACNENRVGRPQAEVSDVFISAVKEWRNGKITAVEAMKKCGVPKATFYKLVKREGL